MPAVAAEQFGVGGSQGAAVTDHHHLQLALVDVDHH